MVAEANNIFPTSVRYVKNGRGGKWWQAAKEHGEIHGGWSRIPADLLRGPGDFAAIQRLIEQDPQMRDPGAQKRDFNQLRELLDRPSRHIWVTFQDSCMWWCTVRDEIAVNDGGGTTERGHFWLTCSRPWSNRSLAGRALAVTDLPGIATRAAAFRGTVCEPQGWETILRVITDQKDPVAVVAAEARAAYERAVIRMIQQLTWQDFELLIDLVLARSGWTRVSAVGGHQEGIDIAAQNLAVGEKAFVQVKGEASQAELNKYVDRFSSRRDEYARMIFAVHTAPAKLEPPKNLPVQVWTGQRLAQLVVCQGLGEWVEKRLA